MKHLPKLFSFGKKKPEKHLYKIDYLTCAHDDGKQIFFKSDFKQTDFVEACDKAEAIKKFYAYMHGFFECGNIYIKNNTEVKPVK